MQFHEPDGNQPVEPGVGQRLHRRLEAMPLDAVFERLALLGDGTGMTPAPDHGHVTLFHDRLSLLGRQPVVRSTIRHRLDKIPASPWSEVLQLGAIHGVPELVHTFEHHFGSKTDDGRIIDRQHKDRGSGRARTTDKNCTLPQKVPLPLLRAGMKESSQLPREGIEARNVQSLVLVAMQATPSQVVENRGTAMLLGDDMVHLKWQRIVSVRHSTVVTAITRHLPNLFQQQPIHAFPLDRLCPAAFSD